MTKESILECERNSFKKFKKYQLPYKLKKIGLVIFILSFIALFIATKGTDFKLIAKYGMLIGLLIVSISKERIEDELIKNIRMQSYTFAFIFAVVITITNPLCSYVVNLFVDKQQDIFDGMGDWQILWLLLSVQVFCFEYIKKMHK